MSSTLLKTGAAVAACAALGSVASRDVDSPWYTRLSKPAFQPPPVAFPVAWTTLYADLALTSARALDARPGLDADGRTAYARALAVNLVLNAGWSWVVFKAHRLDAAVVVAARPHRERRRPRTPDLACRPARGCRPAGLPRLVRLRDGG